ncbi:MAG: hypothetical protein JST26_04440 [Bacteroidetes bacterium]|nr:hypothetical protein [Bacteroidota bacterium]
MKKNYSFISCIPVLLAMFLSSHSDAQLAFRRGSLVVGISEGWTQSHYTTRDISSSQPGKTMEVNMRGCRDPLFFEYGIANRWSIGSSFGNDVFYLNPSKFYGVRSSEDKMKVKTNEVNFEVAYHVLVNKRLDLALFHSFGMNSITIDQTVGDVSYKYTANGTIVRVGARARYYFWKRFGALGMISNYTGTCSPKDVKGNTFGNNYSTNIRGFAVEMGLCYRLIH